MTYMIYSIVVDIDDKLIISLCLIICYNVLFVLRRKRHQRGVAGPFSDCSSAKYPGAAGDRNHFDNMCSIYVYIYIYIYICL